MEARKEISADSWMSEPFNKIGMILFSHASVDSAYLSLIAVCEGLLGNRYEPVELSTPAFHLNGEPKELHLVFTTITSCQDTTL